MKFPGIALLEPIVDLDGVAFNRPLKDGAVEPLTVKYALRYALTAPMPAGEEPTREDKEEDRFETYELARRINSVNPDKNIEFSAEEIQKLKNKAKRHWGVEVYGFLYELLEGKRSFAPFPENQDQP